MATNLTDTSKTPSQSTASTESLGSSLKENASLGFIKSPGFHFGAPSVYLLIRLFLLFGPLATFEGVILFAIYAWLIFREQASDGMKKVTKWAVMPFLFVAIFVPGVSSTPRQFLYSGTTGQISPSDIGLPNPDSDSVSGELKEVATMQSPLEIPVTHTFSHFGTLKVDGQFTIQIQGDGLTVFDPQTGVRTYQNGNKVNTPPESDLGQFPAGNSQPWGLMLIKGPLDDEWQPAHGYEVVNGTQYTFTMNVNTAYKRYITFGENKPSVSLYGE